MQANKFTYGYWRTDIEQEKGFSPELISADTEEILKLGANLDDFSFTPENGCDTLLKQLRWNAQNIPNHDIFGTKISKDQYHWMTCREVADLAEHFSYGIELHNFAPPIQAEGKEWRFIAIQSKNRKEWNLTNLANMHQNITTVSLYDTLGVEATKFIVNQTELTTMVVSNDYITKLCKIKAEDATAEVPKMHSLKNIVAFEDTITPE